ncbi:E3 ubiquitin-protein ligase RNF182 [Festucalex cinctus]
MIEDAGAHAELPSAEELECKICYCTYNLGSRRPKVLECRHRLCARCLAKIQDLAERPPRAVVCPFCRYVTRALGDAAGSLPDDYDLLTAVLALRSRITSRTSLRFHRDRLLLDPRHLSSLMASDASATSTPSASVYSSVRGSPNFVVITIMEPPRPPPAPSPGQRSLSGGLRSSSRDSAARSWTPWNCAALPCRTSACRALVWVLGLLYFSSLPMGVYLLVMQQTPAGVLLVSLVPASLAAVMVYGFCQCVRQEVWNRVPT